MDNKKPPFISLRTKGIALALIAGLIVTFIVSFYLSNKAGKLLYSYKLERMDALGRVFASNTEYGVLLRDKAVADKLCYGINQEPDVLFAIIFDKERNIFAGNYGGIPQKYFAYIKNLLDAKAADLAGMTQLIEKDPFAESEIIIQPIYASEMEATVGGGLLARAQETEKQIIGYSVIVFSLKSIAQAIQKVHLTITGISLIVLVVMVACFYFLVNILIRNLRRLLDTAAKFGRGDLSARVYIHSHDEIEELGEGFNNMAEDLNKITVSRDLLIKETSEREKAQEALRQTLLQHETELEIEVDRKTKELQEALKQIKRSSMETIYRLSLAAEYRDWDTGEHLLRMTRYAAAIAKKMGLDDKYVEAILSAALMHDVGKIGIPDHILRKPGKLTPEEWEIMKKHTTIGAQILKDSEAEFIRLAARIALTHHEKWDGTGYPRRLKGSEIDLAGRIAAVADVFEAVTSKRPYKEAFSVEKALEIIREGRGTHFDPQVVDAFFAIQDEIIAINKETNQDESHNLEALKKRNENNQ
ncbi:MAG: HD domain-containing phosphohydrolase [Candidatus Omnitrophota bacterium]